MPAALHFFIRPFVPTDYDAITAISNAVYPQYPGTVEEKRHSDDARNAKFLHARFVAEETSTGAVVGYAEYRQGGFSFHPRKFGVAVSVSPSYQRRGVGTALYRHLLTALEPFEPIRLRSHVQEDQSASLAFLARHGYVEVMREWESVLVPETFDPAPFAGTQQAVLGAGIAIRTVAELAGDPERDRKLYDVVASVSLDMPNSEASTVPTFTDWHKHTFESPNFLPDGVFIAVDTTANNQYVGVSELEKSLADNQLYTGTTGVLPEYRRRGIALALKLRAIEYAKTVGAPTVRTSNAQSNRAMLAINERLGFVKEPAWIEFHRVLRPEPIPVRQATPRDYDAISHVLSTVWHEFPESADEIRHGDNTRSTSVRHDRFVIEADGAVVAVGEYGQSLTSFDPRKFHLQIAILPAFQGRSFGKAMYAHLLAALRPFAPHTLLSDTLSDRVRAVRFLEERGFVVAQTEQTGKLDVATFDPARYTSDVAKVATQGIVIRTFAELREADPDAHAHYEALHWEVSQDVPHSEPMTRVPMHEWMKRFENPRFLPHANFIATDAATGQYVGMSILWDGGEKNDLFTGITGILRSYRGRGIATALKVHALTYAKNRGTDAVWTSNEVNNTGMLGINARFGFVKQPDELQYTKRIPHDV